MPCQQWNRSVLPSHTLLRSRGRTSTRERGGGVFVSTDKGDSWTYLSPDLPYAPYRVAIHDTCLLATTIHGVYRTTNDGATWNTVNGGLLETPD